MSSADVPPVVLGHGDVMDVRGTATGGAGRGRAQVTGLSVERADGTSEHYERGPGGWRQVEEPSPPEPVRLTPSPLPVVTP